MNGFKSQKLAIVGLGLMGSSLALTLRRDGSEQVVDLTLSARPSLNGNALGRGFQGAMLGEPSDRQRARGLRGVVVNEVASNSRAHGNGLRPGDLITQINGMALDDPARGMEIFRGLADATSVTVTLDRNGETEMLTLDTAALQRGLQASDNENPTE